MSYLSYTKPMGNMMEILMRDHKRYLPIVELLDNVTQNLSELTWAECELIGKEICMDNKSAFCTGIRGGVITALKANDAALDDPKYVPLLSFARKVNKDASAITQADIDAVRQTGWSDQTIEDVVGVVAVNKFYNTISTSLGFGAVPNEAFVHMGAATIESGGYTPMFKAFLNAPG